MRQSPLLKPFFISLFLVLLCGIPLVRLLKTNDHNKITEQEKEPPLPAIISTLPSPAPPLAPKPDKIPESQPSPPLNYEKTLVMAGWTKEAASSVAKLNHEWFEILAKENQPILRRQLKLLAGLSANPTIIRFLEHHPETAGLLASADQPNLVYDTLNGTEEEYQTLINFYVLHADPPAARSMAEALRNNNLQIKHLFDAGLMGSEILYFFDRNSEAANEYELWLHDTLSAKFDASPKELASTINLILKHGPEIRSRLKKDLVFRAQFRSTIWPKLTRVAASTNNMYELYLEDERIWDLLMQDEGEKLLRFRGPIIPLDLLYGYPELGRNPYPAKLHHMVTQILLHGDGETIRALMKFRDEPLFYSLLERPLPPGTQAAAVNKLLEAGDDYPELLNSYSKMSKNGITDEVGAPPGIMKIWMPFYYTLWEVPKKLLQGRNPSSAEWLNSIADPASFLLPVLKVGVALINVGKSISDLEEKEENYSDNIYDAGLSFAEQQLGREIAQHLPEQELINYGITSMLAQIQGKFNKARAENRSVEITKPVQFMFEYSGAGGKTAKIFQTIEARIILHPNIGITITPGNNSTLGPLTNTYLRENNLLTIEDSPSTDQTIISQREIWRRNVAAWFLLNASGLQ
ncbi:MAG: hypothetical protein KKB30_07420 [Proteobacteria bacterium]|nr:hypothetical protein [Pseudomonadota bacterium]MBU1714974.1 hypothetical protein [Pseudomonadota bacterium]